MTGEIQPQFDAKIRSADGKAYLFIRGPFQVVAGEEGGIAFELRIVAVSTMGEWQQIWKGEGVADEA